MYIRYLRYYLRIFKLSLMTEMTNRGNFITWAFVHSVSLITMIAFFKIIYLNTSQINGWTEYQTLLVLGTASLVTGIGSLTFFPFMYNFGEKVRTGEFDFDLLKPLDTHFLSAICWVDLEDIIIVPNSLLLIVYSLWQLHPDHILVSFLVYIFLVINSLLFLFSILTLIESMALRFIQVDSAIHFFWSIVNITKYPAKAITSISSLFGLLLFPVALVSSVPAEVLFGRWDLPWLASSLLVTAVLFVVSRKVFLTSLNHYSSASS